MTHPLEGTPHISIPTTNPPLKGCICGPEPVREDICICFAGAAVHLVDALGIALDCADMLTGNHEPGNATVIKDESDRPSRERVARRYIDDARALLIEALGLAATGQRLIGERR